MLKNVGLRKSVEQPVLDLNFAASQIGSNAAPDSRIDFSRGSNAWFVDSDGLVKKSPHNLITNSETIGGTGWTNRQLGSATFTITLNHALAPNGTLTATKADFSRDNTAQFVFTEQTAGVSATGLTQGSCYIKAASSSDVGKEVHFWQFINSVGIRNQSIATLTSEWQRFELVNTHSHTGTINEPFAIGLINNVGSELNVSVLLWGAQLSQHSTPPVDNPYLKTTGSAVYAARLDHDPTWFMSAAQEQNLFTNSEMLNETGSTGWTPVRTVVTEDSTEDPNGNTTAEKVLEDSTASSSHFVRSPDFTTTKGKSYTASAYVKVAAGTDRLFRIAFTGVDSAFSYIYAQFDLQSGSLSFSNADDSSITDVGNGWFRLSVTETASATADTAEVQLTFVDKAGSASYDGNGTSGFFVWGAQVEVGTSPGTYHRTEGAPYYGPGATPRGLLVEEARTNLVANSEDFTGSQFVAVRVTNTANSSTAPDGTNTATEVVPNTDNNTHLIRWDDSVTSGTTYTASLFVKQASGDANLRLIFNNTNSAFGFSAADFDLSAGTVNNLSCNSASIEAYGNGWFRCSISETATASATGRIQVNILDSSNNNSYAGDGTTGIFIWGFQIEEGSFPTSYIQTTGTTLTRNADVATMGPTTGGTELVVNGTFDDGTNDWSNFSNRSNLSVSSGQLVVDVTDATKGFVAKALANIPVVPGRRYRLSADLAVNSGNGVSIHIPNAVSPFQLLANTATVTSGTLTTVTVDFTCPSSVTEVSFMIQNATPRATTDEYVVDNASLRELYPFEQYNPAEGTVVCEWERFGTGSFDRVWELSDNRGGSINQNLMGVLTLNNNSIYFIQFQGGSQNLDFQNIGVAQGDKNITAYAYQHNNFHISSSTNGVLGTSFEDTSCPVPAVDTFGIGNPMPFNSNFANSHIKRLTYFSYRLANDVCDSKVTS